MHAVTWERFVSKLFTIIHAARRINSHARRRTQRASKTRYLHTVTSDCLTNWREDSNTIRATTGYSNKNLFTKHDCWKKTKNDTTKSLNRRRRAQRANKIRHLHAVTSDCLTNRGETSDTIRATTGYSNKNLFTKDDRWNFLKTKTFATITK